MAAITRWREKGNSLYGAVLILSLMPLIEGMLTIYDKLNNLNNLMSVMGGGDSDMFGASSSSLFVTVLMIFAYILYFTGLTGFAKLQAEGDASSVLRIRNGAVWGLVAEALSFIPIFGWLLSFVASVVAFFIMINGYGRLRRSFTFPAEARRGAGRLRAAMIWSVAAAILHIIPLLGPVLAGIINFILFFVVLSGWSCIKDACPLTIAGRTVIDRLKISDAPNGALIAWGIALTTIVLALFGWVFVKYIIPNIGIDFPWKAYNYLYYLVNSLGLLLFFVGVLEVWKRNEQQRSGLIVLVVASGSWLMISLLNLFGFIAATEWGMNVVTSRIGTLLSVIIYILFIIGYRKLMLTCTGRLMHEGAWALIGFFSLLLFQQLFMLEVIYIGLYAEEYNQFYPVVPWICLYLGVIGWRSVLSALYGKGEIVPTDDYLPNSSSCFQASSRTWIPEEPEVEEQKIKQQEALCEKVLQKTDDELNQILANSEEYKSELVDVVREEKARREQEAANVAAEKVRNEEEMLKYAPKTVRADEGFKTDEDNTEA